MLLHRFITERIRGVLGLPQGKDNETNSVVYQLYCHAKDIGVLVLLSTATAAAVLSCSATDVLRSDPI